MYRERHRTILTINVLTKLKYFRLERVYNVIYNLLKRAGGWPQGMMRRFMWTCDFPAVFKMS